MRRTLKRALWFPLNLVTVLAIFLWTVIVLAWEGDELGGP